MINCLHVYMFYTIKFIYYFFHCQFNKYPYSLITRLSTKELVVGIRLIQSDDTSNSQGMFIYF